eukprot:SAG31_NODE_7464_length_1682_cov_2.217309_1_plen_76_part_10
MFGLKTGAAADALPRRVIMVNDGGLGITRCAGLKRAGSSGAALAELNVATTAGNPVLISSAVTLLDGISIVSSLAL